MEILRNLWRRKVRTSLTVIGIVMGIFALTTMGAMAEHFDTLLAGGITYYSNTVQVADANSSSGFGGGYMDLSTLDRIQRVQGVEAVSPGVYDTAKPGQASVVSMGVPDFINNFDPNWNRYSPLKLTLAGGRWVGDGSRLQVDLGSSFAAEFHMKVGDTIALPVRPSDAQPGFVNHRFTVVGILNPTLTAPDSPGAYVSLHDAQMIDGESLPTALLGHVDPYQLDHRSGGVRQARDEPRRPRRQDQCPGADGEGDQAEHPGQRLQVGRGRVHLHDHRRRPAGPDHRRPLGGQHHADVGEREGP